MFTLGSLKFGWCCLVELDAGLNVCCLYGKIYEASLILATLFISNHLQYSPIFVVQYIIISLLVLQHLLWKLFVIWRSLARFERAWICGFRIVFQ